MDIDISCPSALSLHKSSDKIQETIKLLAIKIRMMIIDLASALNIFDKYGHQIPLFRYY